MGRLLALTPDTDLQLPEVSPLLSACNRSFGPHTPVDVPSAIVQAIDGVMKAVDCMRKLLPKLGGGGKAG